MRRHLVVVLVVLGAVLSACSPDGDDGGPAGSAGYVAVGDSFVSGPGIGTTDPETPGCLRSTSNYAHLVAATMPDTGFRDVSCGGEDTTKMRDGRTLQDGTVLEPQMSSIGRDTTLVTVGIGANDSAATAGLYQYCLLPATAADAACRTFTKTYMPTVYPKIRDDVAEVLDEVQDRAPDAEVRLVGYQRIAPDTGQCAGLPLSEQRRADVAEHEQALSTTLQRAAKDAGVPYLDMHAASQGHDACAGDRAWVNGIANPAAGGGAFLHPTPAGMRAVADALGPLVRR